MTPNHMLPVLLSGAEAPLVDFDSMVFIQLGLFFVLFFILKKFVFGPTMAVLDARYAAMDGAKHDAAQLTKKAEAKFAAFEGEMKRVRVEAQAERDRIRKEATDLERDLLAQAKADADAILADADSKLKAESDKVRAVLSEQSRSLASSIVTKVMGN